jgi:hypothetical protein
MNEEVIIKKKEYKNLITACIRYLNNSWLPFACPENIVKSKAIGMFMEK